MSEATYTPQQTAQIRQAFIEMRVKPDVIRMFNRVAVLKSVMVVVAHYWTRQPYDGIDFLLIFSERETPDFKAFAEAWIGDKDLVNLPSFGDRWESSWMDAIDEECIESYEDVNIPYIIAAFAAFCKPDANDDFNYPDEAYTPYAILRRKDERIEIEIVGEMLRPWLDGVIPKPDYR